LALDLTFLQKAHVQDPRYLLPRVDVLEPKAGAEDQDLGLAGSERGQAPVQARDELAQLAL
jgi:hypothetical protein